MRWKAVFLSLCLLLVTVGAHSLPPKASRTKAMSESRQLAFEPESNSELLAARQVFSIEITRLDASEWKRDPASGLEVRELKLQARVLAVYKGAVQAPGSVAAVLPQRREGALTVSDFHGFWSHQEPVAAAQYLVFSNGDSGDPALLMADAHMADLLPATAQLVEQIVLAIDIERRLVPVDSRAKAVEMLNAIYRQRAVADGLLGRYVCARLHPLFEQHEDAMQTAVMRVVGAEGTTDGLRETLVECLYDESAEQDVTEERAARLLRKLLPWAGRKEAAPMLERMLQVHLYNLIFYRPGAAPLPVARVLPQAAERSALVQAFAAHPSPRQAEIVAWLRAANAAK